MLSHDFKELFTFRETLRFSCDTRLKCLYKIRKNKQLKSLIATILKSVVPLQFLQINFPVGTKNVKETSMKSHRLVCVQDKVIVILNETKETMECRCNYHTKILFCKTTFWDVAKQKQKKLYGM